MEMKIVITIWQLPGVDVVDYGAAGVGVHGVGAGGNIHELLMILSDLACVQSVNKNIC